MTNAVVTPAFVGEHIDSMLRNLKKQLDKNCTFSLYKDKTHFQTKAQRRKTKSDRARKRHAGRKPR